MQLDALAAPSGAATLTEAGGEGAVVKPIQFVATTSRGLLQPAVKCRGREYLRIIYGPEYTLPEHLDRLRERGLSGKRSLALREFALGIEGLERFVQREPLRRACTNACSVSWLWRASLSTHDCNDRLRLGAAATMTRLCAPPPAVRDTPPVPRFLASLAAVWIGPNAKEGEHRQALMRDALNHRVDVVLAESLDRFSRDQEDTAGPFKRLTFAGVKIVTLAEGDITHLHIGFKGTMNALFLKDLAEKTRRDQRGRVEDRKAGGGLRYPPPVFTAATR